MVRIIFVSARSRWNPRILSPCFSCTTNRSFESRRLVGAHWIRPRRWRYIILPLLSHPPHLSREPENGQHDSQHEPGKQKPRPDVTWLWGDCWFIRHRGGLSQHNTAKHNREFLITRRPKIPYASAPSWTYITCKIHRPNALASDL